MNCILSEINNHCKEMEVERRELRKMATQELENEFGFLQKCLEEMPMEDAEGERGERMTFKQMNIEEVLKERA